MTDGRDAPEAVFSRALVDEYPKPDVSVVAVVPAYNEDRFIGSVVLKARPFVDTVIVVDDGSTDQTATIAAQAGAQVVSHAVNQGKAEALKTGFAQALKLGADVVIVLDGDGQHNPREIPSVIRPILHDQADIVVGSRFRETRNHIPLWRRIGQYVLTLITNASSGTPCSDSQSGFRAFAREALKTLSIHCDGFAIESEMQFWAHERGLRMVEAPISCVYAEKSKRNPFRQGLQVLYGIVEMVSRSRPLAFFGLSGFIAAMLGTCWWCLIVHIYDRTGDLALGYALLATLLIILGVLAIFEGVTLHTLRRVIEHPSDPVEEKL